MTGTKSDNPGNFANRPTEEVQEIASKGGKASHGAGGADTNPGNFANRPTEEVREIAAKGGRASHGGGTGASEEESGGKSSGGKSSGGSASNNPGNFANRPKEEVQAIASKGGKASHGGSD
ncbi:stress-induced bacterial acidophilic repeat-containing protein [Rhypophila decipiens]|uniref:Stress-induced bacterial acidophilic repeat-containing protein n=1 Tax=Rhypophila decipiens TaxID=261697 RepID=A0AAN7B274_9PEZI|nr:stress-induced bacterial acidophilic repeat-containing protein [Rhypophila decipiens]